MIRHFANLAVMSGVLHRWLVTFLAGVFVLDALLLLTHFAAPTLERRLGPADVMARQGHAYLFAVKTGWLYAIASDDMTGLHSQLQVVTEAGVPLGPAHAVHDTIRTAGNGAYSHWKGTLYLSMPDNRALEPLTLRAPARLAAWTGFVAIPLNLAAFLALGAICYRRRRALLAVPPVLHRWGRTLAMLHAAWLRWWLIPPAQALARRWRSVALLGILLVDVLIALAHLAAPTAERVLGPPDVVAEEGHAYLLKTGSLGESWLYEVASDGPAGDQSQLRVFTQAGAQLGPAHARHDEIRQTGNGAYSHVAGVLYLSMPGNRPFEPVTLQAPARLASWTAFVALVLNLLALLGLCSIGYRRRRLLLVLGATWFRRWRTSRAGKTLASHWRMLALVAALLIDAALVLAQLAAPTLERTLGPRDVASKEGHAYLIPPNALAVGWLYEVPSDGPIGNRSALSITLGGVPLGPPHAIHDDIRQTGNGAYSHVKGMLYLSMPGNRPLQPVTLRADSSVSTSIIGAAALLTLLALLACLAPWQPRLFTTPWAQARVFHRAGAALAAGLLVLFLAQWLAGPPLIIFRADTAGYLLPALALTQGGALETVERTLGYPAFLAAVIFLTGSLAQIATAQVALVAGTTLATVGLLWLASRPGTHGRPGLAFVQAAAMVAGVTALLAYQPLMNNAHWIMSEALYSFLAVLNMLVLVAAFRKRSVAGLLSLYFLGTFLATYNYHVKPHWGAALVFTWLLLTARLFLRIEGAPRLRLPLALMAPVAAAAIAMVALIAPQRSLHEQYGPRYTLFGPFTLFCVHADLVEPMIRRSEHPPELKAHLLKSLKETLDGATLDGGPGPYTMLGFDPDYCFYRSSLQGDLNTYFKGDIRAQRDLLLGSFLSAVLSNPFGYVSKVVNQITYALTNPFSFITHRTGYRTEYYVHLAKHRRMAPHHMPETWLKGLEPRPMLAALPLGELLGAMLLDGANRFVIAVWAAILAGACLLAARWRRGSAASGRALATMGLASGLYLCSIVVVALAHSFDIERYLLALGPLALCAIAVCLLELSGALWGERMQLAGDAATSAPTRDLPKVI
jgi:hypothetical protein